MVHMRSCLKGPSRSGSSKRRNKITFERCYTKKDNIFECCKSTFFNFGNNITLKDEFTTILKHMNVVKQSLFALSVQPIIQRTFECKTNEL